MNIRIPNTKTALDKQLTDSKEQYIELALCRGTLQILEEQKTCTFRQFEISLPKLTEVIPTPWILRRLLTIMEGCNLIEKIPLLELNKYHGEQYDLAKAKHREYVKNRPGRLKNMPGSIHDGLAYYFLTENGKARSLAVKKNFPKGIAFKPGEQDIDGNA